MLSGQGIQIFCKLDLQNSSGAGGVKIFEEYPEEAWAAHMDVGEGVLQGRYLAPDPVAERRINGRYPLHGDFVRQKLGGREELSLPLRAPCASGNMWA